MQKGVWGNYGLIEKLANIGSEVIRALNWKEKNTTISRVAMERALELIDITLAEEKSYSALKELCRLREILVDFYYGPNSYHSTPNSWHKYFIAFTSAAQINK